MAREKTWGKFALKVVGWLPFLPALAANLLLRIVETQVGELEVLPTAFDFVLVLGVICLVFGYGILGRLFRKIDTKTGAPTGQ